MGLFAFSEAMAADISRPGDEVVKVRKGCKISFEIWCVQIFEEGLAALKRERWGSLPTTLL